MYLAVVNRALAFVIACRVPCQDLLTRPNKQECFVEVSDAITK